MDSSDLELLARLKANTISKIKERRWSLERASLEAGQKKKWAARWLNAHAQISPNSLGLIRLANALETTVDELYGEEELPITAQQQRALPNVISAIRRVVQVSGGDARDAMDFVERARAQTVFDAWLSFDGIIDERFAPFLDYVDIFEPSGHSNVFRVVHFGSRGLAAAILETQNPTRYHDHLFGLSKSERDEIFGSMNSVIETGRGTIACPTRCVHVASTGVTKDVRFARMHLPAQIGSAKGTKKVVINIAHVVASRYPAGHPLPTLQRQVDGVGEARKPQSVTDVAGSVLHGGSPRSR